MCASFNFWQTNSRLTAMFCTFWNWVETLGQQRVIDIFAHSLAAKDLLCVFRNWGCRKFFHRKDTFVCFFLTGVPLVTNNSWLRMITVSEIVRICQTSNYLLDINWPPSRTCKTQWSENNDNDSFLTRPSCKNWAAEGKITKDGIIFTFIMNQR